MFSVNRTGFTIVELLVVIGIIGVLMAVLLPAVQMAREQARNIYCRGNLTQVAKAVINYEGRFGRYPGYHNVLRNDWSKPVNWPVVLLADLDQNSLSKEWRDTWTPTDDEEIPKEDKKSRPRISVLICPSMPKYTPDKRAIRSDSAISYVANGGMWNPDDLPENPANGIFTDHSRRDKKTIFIASDYVARNDGITNTLVLSENLQAGDWATSAQGFQVLFLWWKPPLRPAMRINAMKNTLLNSRSDSARPSSNHGGGVNVAFCDGSAIFLNENISYKVYVALMTPNGRKADTEMLPDFREYQLDAADYR